MKLWISCLLVSLALCATASDINIGTAEPVDIDAADLDAEAAATASIVVDTIDDTPYTSPELTLTADQLTSVVFHENFDDVDAVNRRWVRSASKKVAEAEIAQFDGVWAVEAPQRPLFRNDLGLVLKSKAKHAAIAAPLARPFKFTDKPLVVQYEVQLQEGQTCGGSYLKLLTQDGLGDEGLAAFNDRTPYTIMFGPDKCGNDVKLHFIFRHVNPLTGAVEEKHCRKSKERLDEPFKDKQPHLYTLIVRPDNSYTIRVDHRVVNEGTLLADFQPAVNPDAEIDDDTDRKPADWDEREKIADPESHKPEDWNEDEPAQIVDTTATRPDGWLENEEELVPDAEATKPDDWDTDMDGEWEPPLVANPLCEKAIGCGLWQPPQIPNPAYKGKWYAPLIDNPNYRGKWAPRKIPNPDWFEDKQPFRMKPITAIGFELWSMSGDILFDNIFIGDSEQLANDWAAQSYDLKRDKIETEAKSLWQRMMRYINYRWDYWLAYFVYCSIPIGLYIWYLLSRLRKGDENIENDDCQRNESIQESFVTRVLNFANDNPYMYAVFLVFVGLPLTFIMYYFCKSAPDAPYESNLSRSKKRDLNATDDAAEDATTPSAAESNYALRNRKKTPTTKAAKAAVDDIVEDDAQPSESDSAASNGDEDDESGESNGDDQPPQLIDINDKRDVNVEEEEAAPAKKSPPKPESVADNTRKRRQRKE